MDPTGWRVTLVTNLRVFGYVFNPASFFLCRDPEGELRLVVVEVHNTHAERHLYTLAPERRGASHVASMEKDFYVSPFIEMEGEYVVRVREDAAGLRIAIDEGHGGETLLHTSLVLKRVAPDRPDRRPHAGPPPVRHPQDDRRHLPARLAPVAQGCPVPPSR